MAAAGVTQHSSAPVQRRAATYYSGALSSPDLTQNGESSYRWHTADSAHDVDAVLPYTGSKSAASLASTAAGSYSNMLGRSWRHVSHSYTAAPTSASIYSPRASSLAPLHNNSTHSLHTVSYSPHASTHSLHVSSYSPHAPAYSFNNTVRFLFDIDSVRSSPDVDSLLSSFDVNSVLLSLDVDSLRLSLDVFFCHVNQCVKILMCV